MISRCTSAALEQLEQLVGGVLEVVLGLLLDAALEPRLRPAALVVPAVHVVDDAHHLAHPVGAAGQDPRDLAVGQQHAVAVAARHAP